MKLLLSQHSAAIFYFVNVQICNCVCLQKKSSCTVCELPRLEPWLETTVRQSLEKDSRGRAVLHANNEREIMKVRSTRNSELTKQLEL